MKPNLKIVRDAWWETPAAAALAVTGVVAVYALTAWGVGLWVRLMLWAAGR